MATLSPNFRLRLIRNATITIQFEDILLLVDPLFSAKGALDPIPWTNETRNPTVDLPFSELEVNDLVNSTTAVLLTHLHPDHWDAEAQRLLQKDVTLVCQPEDEATLVSQGFTNLNSQQGVTLKNALRISRVPARHGHGELAAKMAPSSGYIIQYRDDTIYITGDTVWYDGVQETINKYRPNVVVVNAGGAKFQFGDPITMDVIDVINVAKAVGHESKVVVVHMEAINHCYLRRDTLKQHLIAENLLHRCIIPEDGETILPGKTIS